MPSTHFFVFVGQEAVVKVLLQAGAKVNGQSTNGFTPLYMAAQENHVDVVRVNDWPSMLHCVSLFQCLSQCTSVT